MADLGLGDIFQIVSLSRRSGTLQLTTSLDSGEIIFQQGLVVAAYRQSSEQAVGEGLLEKGLLTPTDYQEMLQSQGRGLRGEELFEKFNLKNEATQEALGDLLKSHVYKMLSWDEGGFSFVLEQNPDRWRDFSLSGSRVVVLDGINPQYLAMEGARLRDEGKEPDALEEFLARSRPLAPPELPRPISTSPRAQRFAEQLGTDKKALVRLESSSVPLQGTTNEPVGIAEDEAVLVDGQGQISSAPVGVAPEGRALQGEGSVVPPPASITQDPAAQSVRGTVVPPPASITQDPAAQSVRGTVVPPPASITQDPAAQSVRGTVVPPPASITQDPAARGPGYRAPPRGEDDKVIPFPQERVRRAQEPEPELEVGAGVASAVGEPGHPGTAGQLAPRSLEAPELEPAPGAAREPTGRYLLVVDDDHDLAPLIGQPFLGNFAGLLTATHVNEALEHLRQTGGQVVLAVDLILPRSDGQGILGGLEILEAARAWYPHLPAVMFTDYHNVEAEQRARELGVVSILVKPRRALMFEAGTQNPSAAMWAFLDSLGGALEPHFSPGVPPSLSPASSAPASADPASADPASADPVPMAPPTAEPPANSLPTVSGDASAAAPAPGGPRAYEPLKTGPVGEGIYDLAREIVQELGEEHPAQGELPPASPSEGAISELRAMLAELADPANRETVTLLVLRFAADVVDRAALFLVTRTHFVGLGGFSLQERSDDYVRRVRRLKLKREAGSVFDDVLRYRSLVRRVLKDTPQNRALLEGLCSSPEGNWHSNEVIAVPLISADRVAAILFGDNPSGKGLGRTDALEIFMQQAGLAMDRVLLERQLEEARRRSQT